MKNKKKDEKHKLRGECFNNCVEWKLNTSITINKTTYGYVIIYLSSYLLGEIYSLGNYMLVY